MWSRAGASEIVILAEATALGFGVVTLVDLMLKLPVNPTLTEGLLRAGMVFATALALRYRERLIRGFRWHHHAVGLPHREEAEFNALIVGAGRVAASFVRAVQADETAWRYRFVGFVDDDERKHSMLLHGLPILGTRHEVPALVQQYRINLIILAMGSTLGPDFRDILSICQKTGAVVRITPDISEVVSDGPQTLVRDIVVEDLLGRNPVSCDEEASQRLIEGATIAITGAAGSIGSHLSRYILRFRPKRLLLIDINETGLYDLVEDLRAVSTNAELSAALCDVTDTNSVDHLFASMRPRVVFHGAAYKHVPVLEVHPHQAVRVNVGGTRCVLTAAIRRGVERFILLSTDKAARASTAYGLSKLLAERVVFATGRGSGTRCTAVRFGNVLGSRGSVVPTFVRQIAAGSTVTVTHPDMRRYLMAIGEAVTLLVQAAVLTRGDDMYMLEMGEDVRIVDLAERVIRMRGLRPGKDVSISFTGLRPGEELEEELIRPDEERWDTPIEGVYEIHSTNHISPKFLEEVDGLVGFARADHAATLRRQLEMLAASPEGAAAVV
jgi:FlaA1/EpsC-like NDP-sugar epimerase